MQLPIVGLVILRAAIVFTAPTPYCPNGCTCESTTGLWQVHCPFFDFLNKASPSQLATIQMLDLSQQSIQEIDPSIKRLTQLKNLNLRSNKISVFLIEQLPKSLQDVDLSANNISDIPKSWHMLPHLRHLDLSKNPISCGCDSLQSRDYLEKADVKLVLPETCHSPPQLRGKLWTSVTSSMCADKVDLFQGDEPYEGSGNGDTEYISADGVFGNLTEEKEFIPVSTQSIPTLDTLIDDDEGSGDFGGLQPSNYDEDEEQEERLDNAGYDGVQACHFNCSTVPPLDQANETNLSPAPGFIDGIRIIASDLGIIASSTTTTPRTTSEVTVTEYIATAKNVVVNADLPKSHKPPPPQQATSLNGPESTYAFLGGLLVILLCIIIYAILKRRRHTNRKLDMRNRNGKTTEPMEQLKLLNKPSLPQEKSSGVGIKESSTLLDNHNHKNERSNSAEYEEVVLRPKKPEDDYLLTPTAQRVTIKATELPNSVPKTPLLVTRHVASDGNIVTTPT